MGDSNDKDIVETLVRARAMLAEDPPPRSKSWRGIHVIRRASRLFNPESFTPTVSVALRVLRQLGHGGSEDFSAVATDAQELAVFDEAIALVRARASSSTSTSTATGKV